ncbi:MAG TPA: TIGR03620 family F420-dependent LLM class oxidoreductase [Mycobacterium sp.]|jgi:probable F420-dependent oxidoreductase|nr:TIGR03620 family F420-dependent LLM class oxidoreductase [Mycobacterium sp.]
MTVKNRDTVGVWAYPSTLTAESVNELERLGYSALWLADPGADLGGADRLLAATERMVVGTYIVNVWSTPAEVAADAFHRIDVAFPGRFVLGIGAGHREINGGYRKPFGAVVEYLDALDDLCVPRQRRALAALGPRMLGLARDRTAAALPYMITPDYIRSARSTVGLETRLLSEQKVILTDDAQRARALARDGLGVYLGLSNVRLSLQRIGFHDDDLNPPGSDRLIDALVAYGTTADIAARVREHLNAGADQVLVHAIAADNDMMPALRVLAGRL